MLVSSPGVGPGDKASHAQDTNFLCVLHLNVQSHLVNYESIHNGSACTHPFATTCEEDYIYTA